MRYTIKYIQSVEWNNSLTVKTDRGYECWINKTMGYVADIYSATIYSDINQAFRNLQMYSYSDNGPLSYYHIIEEIL